MEATNERGQKALEFTERHKLVIANTLFKHKRSRLVSWHALNGRSYQINFIIVTNKLKSCIQMKSSRNFLQQTLRVTMTWWCSPSLSHCSAIKVWLFQHLCYTAPPSLFHGSTVPPLDVLRFNPPCSTVPRSLFHCSNMIFPPFHHQMFYCSNISIPQFHHQMFHYYTIKSSTVSPSLFHCSIIKCSTVPPSHVLLFHHLYSTVPP